MYKVYISDTSQKMTSIPLSPASGPDRSSHLSWDGLFSIDHPN